MNDLTELFLDEIWAPIEVTKGVYEVSTYGRIRHTETKKIKRTHLQNAGYEEVTFTMEPKKSKKYYVHRIVAMSFIPNPNNYPVVNHKDEVKTNNTISNLEWCTDGYNIAYSNKLHNRKPGAVKHTEESKAKMSAAHKGKPSPRKGMHHSDETKAKLAAIVKGKKWKIDPETGKRKYYFP